jgi:hypothetical protein
MASSKLRAALAITLALGGCGPASEPTASKEPAESIGVVSSKLTQLTLGADNTWTWYDAVPGAMCADGSATGFAVNPLSTGNGKVMIFLEGGGMCGDAASCQGPFKTATHFNYGASTFASEMTSSGSKAEVVNVALFASYTWNKTQGTRGIWDRTSSSNPFKSYNYVFIPHCTADMFWGNRHDTSSSFPGVRAASNQWFMGYSNFAIFAQQVKGFWAAPPSITLLGGSAGGYGALYNYPQLKALYGETPVNVVVDSATPLWTGDDNFSPRQGFWMHVFEPPGVPSYEEDWFADAWGLDSTHPAGVTAVTRTGAQRSIYPTQAALLAVATGTSDQFGFIQGNNDWVTPWYLHLNVNGLSHPNVADGQADFTANVTLSNVHTHFVTSTSDPNPNLRVWNQHHGYVLDDVGMWTQTGILPWLTQTFSL